MESIAVPSNSKINIQSGRDHHHEQNGESTGITVLWRQSLRILIDRSCEHTNITGKSDQRRNFKRFERADKDQQEHRRKVCQTLAPQAAEASSSDGSIDRKEAASMRNTKGDQSNASMKIIPAIE